MIVTTKQLAAALEKQRTEIEKQFSELYAHLKIHRAKVNATPERYELKEGAAWNPFSSFWSFPPLSGNTRSLFTTAALKKKPAKRAKKKGAK